MSNKQRKTIFVICKEHYSYPMFFLARMLKSKGYRPVLIFVHFAESYLNTASYNSYKKNFSDIESVKFDEVYEEYCNISGHADLVSRLPSLLCDLGISKEYWRLRCSTQLFTSHEHYRFYFKNTNRENQDAWLFLNCRKVKEIFDEYLPNAVIDIDNAELVRSIIYSVCQSRGVEYRTLESTRLEDMWYINETFGVGIGTEFESTFLNMTIDSRDLLEVNTYRSIQNASVAEYRKHSVIKNRNGSFLNDMRLLLTRIKSLSKKFVKNHSKIGMFFRRDYIAGYAHSVIFFLLYSLRKRFLLSELNYYFNDVKEGDQYVFFPLHLIPESTTAVKTPLFLNELDLIKIVSRALPVGVSLYVKEHGAMIGERPLSFYREVLRIPGVKFLKLNQFDTSLEWIDRSKGVITLSGTTALEAAFVGKRSIVLADVPFSLISSIDRLMSFDDIPKWLADLPSERLFDKESLARYLKTSRELGIKWPIHTILKECRLAASYGTSLPDDVIEYLNVFSERAVANV